MKILGSFPKTRLRRLRKSKWLRKDQKILIGDIFNYKALEKAIVH